MLPPPFSPLHYCQRVKKTNFLHLTTRDIVSNDTRSLFPTLTTLYTLLVYSTAVEYVCHIVSDNF